MGVRVQVARRFQPGIFLINVQILEGRGGPCVLRLGLSLEGMPAGGIPLRILIPGMSDILGDVRRIDGVNFGEVAAKNGATGQEVTGGVRNSSHGIFTIGKEVS